MKKNGIKIIVINLICFISLSWFSIAKAEVSDELKQCLDLCGTDEICVKNCKRALSSEAVTDEEGEDDEDECE